MAIKLYSASIRLFSVISRTLIGRALLLCREAFSVFWSPCTIARYGYVWNVHRMSVKIEHRNLEIRKTRNNFSVQVWNFLLTLSLKVLRHKEREAQSFYSGFFICPTISCDTCPRPRRANESQLSSPEGVLNSTPLTDFFKISQNPPRASGAWCHLHSVTPFSILGYCDISEWDVNVSPKQPMHWAKRFSA